MSKPVIATLFCKPAVTARTFRCLALATLCMGLTAGAQNVGILTFDAPGATDGTLPVGINLEGVIAGSYADASQVYHGFLFSPDGKYTTFDAPGAGTIAKGSYGTFPAGISVLGAVAGYYNDNNFVSHGFLRSPNGELTTFDAPGSDTKPADQLGTLVSGINALGVISGNYADTAGVYHGFLRYPDGTFVTIDAPGAAGYGTFTDGPLNLEGAVVGYYTDASYLFHAFVRGPDGKVATFLVPGSCTTGTPAGCYADGLYNINDFGISVGAYEDNGGNFVAHGFLRYPDGTIKTFDAPGAGTGLYQGTGLNQIAGLNNLGTVAATYLDTNNVYHGFLRTLDGRFSTFDVPGADLKAGDMNGTFPVSINDLGVMTGYYADSQGVPHGFLRVP